MTQSYLLRPRQELAAGVDFSDALFANTLFEGRRLEGVTFAHCTFANVSFKDAVIADVRFEDCAFIDVYFRRTRLSGCLFAGNRFISCRFPRVTLSACDFRYAEFEDCFVSFADMEHCLPGEPNLREGLADVLAREASSRGAGEDARSYRLTALAAHERHLALAVKANTEWYRDHYPTTVDRTAALLRLARSKLNGALWGYGERPVVLLRNLGILGLILFPLLFLLIAHQLATPDGDPGVLDTILLSLASLVSIPEVVAVRPTGAPARILILIEAAAGIVFLGLFISLLLKWMVRR